MSSSSVPFRQSLIGLTGVAVFTLAAASANAGMLSWISPAQSGEAAAGSALIRVQDGAPIPCESAMSVDCSIDGGDTMPPLADAPISGDDSDMLESGEESGLPPVNLEDTKKAKALGKNLKGLEK